MIGSLASISSGSSAGEKVGVVVLTILCAGLLADHLLKGGRRLQSALLGSILLLTPVLLLVDIWHSSQVAHLRAHPALAVLAALAAAVVVAALTLLFRRRPAALPIAAFLALPFRLPIAAGGTASNLLVPLYLVVAAGACARIIANLLDREDSGAQHPVGAGSAGVRAGSRSAGLWSRLSSPRGLQSLLAATVLLYGLQSTYSADFTKSLENVAFFLAPFTVLFILLRDAPWSRRLAYTCLGYAAALGFIFAGVGFIELGRQKLFLNPKLVQANEYGSFFRVNSVFFDPNIYGRYLALVLVALTVAMLRSGNLRRLILLGALMGWLWAGLISSFSQSSMAALLLGLAIIAAWRWDTLSTVYTTLAGGLLVLVIVLLAPPSAHFGLTGEGGSANNATSGRASLITGGLSLFADRPLQGFGSGSFAAEYKLHRKATRESAVSASHTIPVTIAAEQGLIGLLLYGALIASSLAVLFRGAGRSPPRLVVAACYSALLLHTMAYADFLEDPTTWALLALGIAFAARLGDSQAGGDEALLEPA